MSRKAFKKTVFRDQNHMLFESGYKAFDRQVDLICQGNVISNVQYSTSIHSVSDDTDGRCAPGEVRRADVSLMTCDGQFRLPYAIAKLLDKCPNESFWCYRLMLRHGDRRTPIAWILTNYAQDRVLHAQAETSDHPGVVAIWKREAVLKTAIPYLVKGDWK